MTAAERYALVGLAGGGLLLDCESGVLLQLNGTATSIWRQFLDGTDADAIASKIAERHGITPSRAREDVAVALTPGAPPAPAAPEEYQFRRTAAGYVQFFKDRPVLELDAEGAAVTVASPAELRRPRRLENALHALVPKILSLRGFTVFHASAVLVQGRLLAFSGLSGAGKTTTARALAERGATLVCEDKLVVDTDEGRSVAWRGAEPHVYAWVPRALSALLAEGRVDCTALDEAARGERLPIAEMAFIDATARRGNQLVAHRLEPQDVAAAAFRGMFLGTALASGWRRQLEAAAAFAASVHGYDVTMPDGLEALGRAAAVLERRGTLAG